ncbi:MAG: hypothetical protein A3H01_00925 [Candidatus Wildermuthbacteria bacterium RIFCSPLOWO2_12_FULL_40_9]|uniref:Maf-like protein n=2 Tax=Candidatus Wildermuthiibacteriota TaxID=1817923 RepID=A0A1G2RF83_9BACT|nr:MAG: hypothetical protein A3F15_02145 [Candidatus Wildermuthbacteria bacterium RIFCSPHIGHO2_12_FULL_40_12]OHA76823.1 MAG: hypothetical protein A3H01_00925 [Candidatus Wildermuthbacteria bacterium RIFCSPLOWO2_12_FULL_40_9]
MRITICGSIAFYDEMQKIKQDLEVMGRKVQLPPEKVIDERGEEISVKKYYDIRKMANDKENWVWDRKSEAIMNHFKKIEWADAILVLNYEKNGVPGYIGGNTLMEIGLAFFLKKKIYFLNEIPELSYKEELLGVKSIVIGGDLNKII